MYVYLLLMGAVLVCGYLMPQSGSNRKNYIVLMAVLHAFICGFRYMHLTGDLMKYHTTFNTVAGYGWFSPELWKEGRNSGMYIFLKLVNHLTGGDYQFVLVAIAVLTETAFAKLVYRFSPAPWMSYMVWNALGFYSFGFSAIKQMLAMAFVIFAVIALLENNWKKYLLMMLLAGSVHAPALIVLPAYWIAKRKVNIWTLLGYSVITVLVFIFKDIIVVFMSDFYYEERETMVHSGNLGNRFLMILLIVLCGVALKGFQERGVEALFHLMVVSMMLQMFSGYNNIFTRLTDYYFQFSAVFIPMIFYPTGEKKRLNRPRALFVFNAESIRVFKYVVTGVLLYFFWVYTMREGQVTTHMDDILNYRFMWDVR